MVSKNTIYDYLIVGAGFFGSICAHELQRLGFRCLVIDKRQHIGGNCYTEIRDNINVHMYGPHIFHTSNELVWKYINKFTEFNDFRLSPAANYKGEIYSLPFNMWTFSKLWGVSYPSDAEAIIAKQSADILDPKNLEEQAIKLVGRDAYEKLIKGYTKKQWMRDPKTLPREIITRLPVRFTYDNNYFSDKYQGIPIGGYTKIFHKLLASVEVRLGVDYLSDRDFWNSKCEKIIYTGAIDELFDFEFGCLEYKSTKFDHVRLEVENYQGVAMMNFTDEETAHTRVIEHKHFENSASKYTHLTWEYPIQYRAKLTEPLYPVNDHENNTIFEKYRAKAASMKNLLIGGRLAEYRYYDMHQVIERALNFVDSLTPLNNK